MDRKKERNVHKGLALGWLGCLASIPVTGPLGLIGAGVLFLGQVNRFASKEGSWEAYTGIGAEKYFGSEEEKNNSFYLDSKKDKDNPFLAMPKTISDYSKENSFGHNTKTNSQIETQNPFSKKYSNQIYNLLDKENERKSFESSLKTGVDMLETHLSSFSYEDYSKIKQIEIIEKEKTFFGVPIGKKSLEVRTLK